MSYRSARKFSLRTLAAWRVTRKVPLIPSQIFLSISVNVGHALYLQAYGYLIILKLAQYNLN